ncbi:MAG: hypothetical protein QF745_03670, partial [Planctomycetota bacterium]|nr:hypothetical protein [Planctomycetota bacterium]
AGICFEDFLRPRCPSRMEEALCEDDMEGVTRTTWTWFCRSSYCRHGGVLQVRVVPAVDVVERFWNSDAGDAFSFCGSY